MSISWKQIEVLDFWQVGQISEQLMSCLWLNGCIYHLYPSSVLFNNAFWEVQGKKNCLLLAATHLQHCLRHVGICCISLCTTCIQNQLVPADWECRGKSVGRGLTLDLSLFLSWQCVCLFGGVCVVIFWSLCSCGYLESGSGCATMEHLDSNSGKSSHTLTLLYFFICIQEYMSS